MTFLCVISPVLLWGGAILYTCFHEGSSSRKKAGDLSDERKTK